LQGTISGNTITTKHLIPTHLSSNTDLQDSFRTFIGDTAPDPTKYSYWIDTSGNSALKKIYQNSSWNIFNVNLSVDKAISSSDTVTGVSRLSNEGASSGDIKYVYNTATNTIDEYVYYDNNWALKGGANGDTTVTDTEGHIYNPIEIGTQTWLDKNMYTKYYPDGSLIAYPFNKDVTNTYSRASTDADTSVESAEEDPENEKYGYFYQAYSATNNDLNVDTRGICPYGYHIPSSRDLLTMFHYLDNDINMTTNAIHNDSSTLKSNLIASGNSGFNLQISGIRSGNDSSFHNNHTTAYLMGVSVDEENRAVNTYFSTNSVHYGDNLATSFGYPVRCMKDQRSLLDINDIFGDGSIIGTWQLNGNKDELGGNYTVSYESGLYGSAYFDDGLYIDGEDYYVVTTFNPHTDANFGDNHVFSMSLWVYLNSDVDDGNDYQYLIESPYSGGGFRFFYRVSGGNIGLYIGNRKIYTNSTIDKEQWTHLVYSYDGTDIKIYFDGALILQTEYAGNGIYADNSMKIGTNNSGHFFRGKIDQVRLFNRVLTPFEIQTLFTEKRTR
jgi:uncharacterized protein (TIGR02145 family)